jgi:hypothetical protein
MAQTPASFIGLAKVHVRPYGSTGKRRHVGNVSSLVPTPQVNTQRQPDFQKAGGGTLIRHDRVEQINWAMTWLDFSPANWALATAGVLTEVASGSVTVAETVKLWKGTTTPLAHPPSNIDAVTNVGATTTYDAGDDFVMSGGGLYVPDASGITDGADHLVTYDYHPYANIEGAMNGGTDLEFWVEGVNEVGDERAWTLDIWKVRMPAASQIAMISTTLGEMPFNAESLKDPNRGAGVSGFYRHRLVQPPAA